MTSKLWKRTAAGAILAGSLLLGVPAIATPDTLVYQGTSGGGYRYINANTGLSFVSASYLGKTFETHQCQAR